MDNHDSHVSIEGLSLAKDNGIALLTLPPHCSYKLQPLDHSVYGHFKKQYNGACGSWMFANPGKPMTIYDVAGIVGKAFPLAFTSQNALSGFRVSGIWPFDRNVFGPDEYLSSYVIDCENPNAELEPQPGGSVNSGPFNSPTPSTATVSPKNMSPEEIQPFPKAQARLVSKLDGKREKQVF